MRPISAAIADYRRAKKWTQSEMADAVGVTAATISAWENERLVPTAGSKAFPKLSDLLGLNLVDLEKSVTVAEARQSRSSIWVWGVEEFVRAQRELLEIGSTSKDAPFKGEVWILFPRALPIAGSSLLQESWVNNLVAGVDYHVVWAVDFPESDALLRLGAAAMAKIGRAAAQKASSVPKKNRRAGTIRHYLLLLTTTPLVRTLSQMEDWSSLTDLLKDEPLGEDERKTAVDVSLTAARQHLKARDAFEEDLSARFLGEEPPINQPAKRCELDEDLRVQLGGLTSPRGNFILTRCNVPKRDMLVLNDPETVVDPDADAGTRVSYTRQSSSLTVHVSALIDKFKKTCQDEPDPVQKSTKTKPIP